MPKKGELSKTARASLANRETVIKMLDRTCEVCKEPIQSDQLLPVKVMGKGMVYYHKDHYKMQ